MNAFLTVVIFGLMFVSPFESVAQKADLVLKNGVVHTVDESMSRAEAVAVSGDKILAVGSDTEIATFVDAGTRVIDLEGKTVVPGLIDSHYHFMGVGRREFRLDLDGTKSLQEFLSKIEAQVKEKPPGAWIVGRGWIEEDWSEKRFPTRFEIDRLAPNNPVFLKRADGHAAVANTAALRIAGITKETPDPEGGQILRDPKTAEVTGMLLEDTAQDLVEDLIPPDTSRDVLKQYAQEANDTAVAYGVTTIHNMGQPWKNKFWTIFNLWEEMYENNELQVRINTYIEWPFDDVERLFREGLRIGLYEHHLSILGIKITQDGALGSRGAALLEPYSDAETSGSLIYENAKLLPIIKRALENNIQMAIHAIGDRANRNVLDLYEQVLSAVPLEQRSHMPPRFRIEHAQIVAPEDIPRFAELGMIPSMQPSHAIGDLHFAVRRLGLDRMKGAYAWRTFIDNGGYIPAGSDAPVEEGNPMIEFYAACVRKDTTGFSAEGWHPELKMTRAEALKSLTIWGAKAAFQEEMLGSLEPGKLADLVVLDRDLMTEPEARLFDINVLMTMVGGEVVFDRNETYAKQ